MNELEIVQAIQKGDLDRFVELYDVYIKKIYNFIFYKIGNKDDAQDLTSDVFVKAFDKINTFKTTGEHKFSSWLYMIAQNCVIDFFRENSKKQTYQILEDISTNTNILQNIDDKQKLDQVLDYLNTLDNSKKEIFIMRVWDNLSYEEISAIVGKSTNNCKTIFSRTLKDIISRFGTYGFILLIHLKHLL